MHHVAMHEEDIVSLVSRAHARCRFPDLQFVDPWAEDVLAKVDVDLRGLDDSRLRNAAERTIVIDDIVRGFFGRHPEGLAVALHPGLCTRFSRVDNGELQWVDLDPPGLVALKCELYGTPDRHMVASCCSLTCSGWMEQLRGTGDVPTILVSQGALLRCPPEDIDAFLTRTSECFPAGTELVLDHDARCPLRPSSLDDKRACLEIPDAHGRIARYPRLRFVPTGVEAPGIDPSLGERSCVSRTSRGHAGPFVAHLRFG